MNLILSVKTIMCALRYRKHHTQHDRESPELRVRFLPVVRFLLGFLLRVGD